MNRMGSRVNNLDNYIHCHIDIINTLYILCYGPKVCLKYTIELNMYKNSTLFRQRS